MIPAEAVEAAKKVAFERYGSKPDTAYLRTILEAAAPHMLAAAKADAWDEATKAMVAAFASGERRLINPYRTPNAR